jgi:hypothetical protein
MMRPDGTLLTARGWWGDNIDETADDALVIEGPAPGIDQFAPAGIRNLRQRADAILCSVAQEPGA